MNSEKVALCHAKVIQYSQSVYQELCMLCNLFSDVFSGNLPSSVYAQVNLCVKYIVTIHIHWARACRSKQEVDCIRLVGCLATEHITNEAGKRDCTSQNLLE